MIPDTHRADRAHDEMKRRLGVMKTYSQLMERTASSGGSINTATARLIHRGIKCAEDAIQLAAPIIVHQAEPGTRGLYEASLEQINKDTFSIFCTLRKQLEYWSFQVNIQLCTFGCPIAMKAVLNKTGMHSLGPIDR